MFFRFSEIINKINDAGRSNTSFLFGIDFEMNEGFFVKDPLQQQAVLFHFNGIGNSTQGIEEIPSFHFSASPDTFATYEARFNTVMSSIQKDEVRLVNLTVKTPIECSLPLSDIFHYSNARYRLYIPNKFVCFSPETFVAIEKGKIRTFPMKGTIEATIPNAASIILNDPKESAEHRDSVALLISDLERASTDVSVKRFRYIDTLTTNKGEILQVSSEIEGTLQDHYRNNIGALLSELLPAGSIAGVPKVKSLDIIREAEQTSRGYYTGIAGYFDGEKLDTCVLIRFIEQEGDRLFFRSGGGITAQSNCEKEYNEAIRKIYLPFPCS